MPTFAFWGFQKEKKFQRVPGRIKPRRNTPRHIVIRLTKIKERDKLLKTTGKNDNIQGNSHQVIS